MFVFHNSAAALPLVGITRSRKTPGVDSVNDFGARPLEIYPLSAALLYPWPCDAHLVTYSTRFTGHLTWPRCNKVLLQKLRMAGGELKVNMIVQDYDNPGHVPWTPGLWSEFQTMVGDMAEAGCTLATGWTFFHTSRCGARFVYVLDKGMQPEESEQAHRAMVVEADRWGLKFDRACSDWTRLFRLPFVTRRGAHGDEDNPNIEPTRTWEDDFIEHDAQWGKRLEGATTPRLSAFVPTESNYGEVEELDLPKPTPQEADLELIVKGDKGYYIANEFAKQAKRRLVNRNCFDCIWKHKPIAVAGKRNSTIHSYVGEAISLLGNMTETTPQRIYALFFPAVEQLEPDEQTTDWTDVLWDAIRRIWAKERAKLLAVTKFDRENVDEDIVVFARGLLDRVREWCDHPTVLGNDDDALKWLLNHLVVKFKNSYHVLQRNGYYDNFPTDERGLKNRIKHLGMDGLLQLKKATANGIAPRTVDELITEHATQVAGGRMILGMREVGGATIEKIDREDAQLVLTIFQRKTDLTPTYDKDCDEWLQQLGGDKYLRLCEWIGRALQFEGGAICALAIIGSRGVGKKMLAYGLAECISSEEVADKQDLTGAFQHSLLQSPFLLVNEGFPSTQFNDPSDTFRALVAGDGWSVARKFLPPVMIRCPYRVILTANNEHAIKTLCGKRDMTIEDIEALAQRLTMIQATPACRQWLEAKGGKQFTARPGRRWIRGDSGEKSDYVLAKHFMWLYYQYKNVEVTNPRFLVEGDYDPLAIGEMKTETGAAPLVIEVLITMLNSKRALKGMVIEGGAVHVLPSEVLNFFRKEMSSVTTEKLNASRISQIVRSLSSRVFRGRCRNRTDQGTQNWNVLDSALLWQVCQRYGWQCPVLEQLVAGAPIINLATATIQPTPGKAAL